MSKKLKSWTVCKECGRGLKRANPSIDSICQICKETKELVPKDFSKTFEVKLDTAEQKLAALDTVGEAFRHHGGSSLMLTEHIENGLDAIEDFTKTKKIQNYKGKIDIIIDDQNKRVIVIDNGTGIIDPIWIIEHPLKSRKTGVMHQHGEFGRGLQGFRGFCESLQYITVRERVSKKESDDKDITQYLNLAKKKGVDGRCISLKLSKTSVETCYEPVKETEFKKYTSNKTGTIAIFSKWIKGDFENLIRDKNKLFERIQHHFRVVLQKNIVKISIIRKNLPLEIKPREFSIEGDEMDLFELKPRKCIEPYTKQEFGTIYFKLYKAAPRYDHTYKSPFLLVGDRPLGNSDLLKIEEFSDNKILKSPYLTGYVIANFLKPDSLRLSPKPGPEFNAFVIHMKAVLEELQPMLDDWVAGFRVANKNDENQKLILQVQSFLKNQNIPLNLAEMTKAGDLFLGTNPGNSKEERISSIPGNENEGLISKTGNVEAVILYEKNKQDPTKTKKKKRLKVQINRDSKNPRDPKKDGRSTKSVYIHPNLMSKDGRIRQRNFVGPGLDNYRGELDPNLSKWDASNYLVLVNELHPIYQMYEEQRKKKYGNEIYSPKQKNMIQESYLRHVIKNCAKDMDNDKKDRTFWELKYKFFLGR